METNLLLLRLKSIAWTILGVAITAVLGYLSSTDFAALLTQYTGTAVTGTLVTLVVTELIKHLRNKHIIAGISLGAAHAGAKPDLI